MSISFPDWRPMTAYTDAGENLDIYNNLEDFGGVGDDSTDNTSALADAISAYGSNGKPVYIPDGTFVCSNVVSPGIIASIPAGGLIVIGNGPNSILKKGAFGTTDVEFFKGPASKVVFRDFKMDMNGTANPSPASPTVGLMSAIRVDSGDSIRIIRVDVTNQAGQRIFSIGGAGSQGTDVAILDCEIDTVSAQVSGNTNAYDHSSIYIEAKRAIVAGNKLSNSGQGTTSTAIEAHGHVLMIENIIENYNIGFILAALYANATEMILSLNQLRSVRQFINCYSSGGYWLEHVKVANNILGTNTNVAPLIDIGTNVTIQSGIFELLGNTIFSTASQGSTLDACGLSIGMWDEVIVTGENTFKDLTGRAIQFNASRPPSANRTRVFIDGTNRFIDCGFNNVGGSGHTAVYLSAANELEELRVIDCEFENAAPAFVMQSGTISVTNGSTAVTGSGTTFTSLTKGSVIRVGTVSAVVDSVADDTNLTLASNWSGTTQAGVAWALQTLAKGVTRTGTLSLTNGNTAVTGSGTSFLTELEDGQYLQVGATTAKIASIASATSLTLDANWAGATQSGVAWKGGPMLVGLSGNVPSERVSIRDIRGNLPVLDTWTGTVAITEYDPPKAVTAANASGNTTVNSTSKTDITGATVTITPKHDCVAVVRGTFDVDHATVSAGEVFAGELDVNGSPQTGNVALGGGANTRASVGRTWRVNLTAGTAYTFKLRGFLSVSSGSYTVYATNTSIAIELLPRY